MAHVRLASVGTVDEANSHPFVARGLAFMHNGTVHDFKARRGLLEAELHSQWRTGIRGQTDSEACFALMLSYLEGIAQPSTEQLVGALLRVVRRVSELYDVPGETPSALTFVVSDGDRVVSIRRGRTLFHIEAPGYCALASEKLWDDERWAEVPEDTLVAFDGTFSMRRWATAQL